MKVENINPFISASFEVLKEIIKSTPKQGKVFLKNKPEPSYNVSVMVGVVGEVEGQVVYSLTHETGKKIASAMMMGAPVDEFDEMAKSAVSELANMITGNASTQISNKGLKIDISPPTLITGEGVTISMSTEKIKIIVVPLQTELGEFEINLCLN